MSSRSLGHRAPLLWLVAPMIAGLGAAKANGSLGIGASLLLATIAALAAVWSSWRNERAWPALIAVAMFFAGAASYTLHRARLESWEHRPPREVQVAVEIQRVFIPPEGRRSVSGLARIVRADPHIGELQGQRVYFSFTLKKGESLPIRGMVLHTSGVIAPIPRDPAADSFDEYLANAGVNFRLNRARVLTIEKPPTAYRRFLEHGAEKLNACLNAGVAEKRPELAAIYRAMMLGQKRDLSTEQETLFVHSGTMHLFAINGLHIGVVALALHALLAVLRFPRPIAAVITLGVLWLDVDTTGASPSAVRAFLLVAGYETAYVLRRPINGLAALSAAALFVLLLDPMALFSASFQMSYGVVLAILAFGLPLSDWLDHTFAPFRDVPAVTWTWRQKAWAAILRWLWPVLGIGISAALVSAITGPAFFKTFAPAGFFANLLLVPVAMFVIMAGFASVFVGVLGAVGLSALFNHAAMMLLVLIDTAIRHGVGIPAGWWQAGWRVPGAAPLALAGLLIILVAGYLLGWRRERGSWWPPFAFVAAALAFGVKFG